MSNSGTHNIHISASRVNRGGFLPALLAALPTIASVISGIAGASTIVSNIKNMIQGKGCYIPPQRAQGLISDLNIPVISPLAKFIGLGKSKGKRKSKVASGLY